MDTTCRLLTMEGITWRRLPSCWWVLVTYAVLAATSPTLQSMPTPKLLLRSGSTLELNCSLPTDEKLQGYNASDLRFEFKGREWPGEQVEVVDERTVRLHIPGANRTLTGNWSCAVRGRQQPLSKQSVTIADLPVKPNMTGCIVYNWDSMTCTWEPKEQDTGIPTNQTLYWTLMVYRRNPPYYHCPLLRDNTCTWIAVDSANSFKRLLIYGIFVAAQNELATTSTIQKLFDTKLLVKPNPVADVVAVEKGAYHVELRWTEPKAQKDILYKVNYNRQGSHTWREVNVTTTHANITGLLPYWPYTFRISCIPRMDVKVVGFWSKAVDTTISTNPSVPSAAPAISPGGFRTLDDQHNKQKRQANIFWKSIPAEQRNGMIETYRVRYRTVLSDTWESEYWYQSDTAEKMVKISLDKDKAYQVVVDAATQVGYNESLANSLTPIYIAQREKVPPKPHKLAVVSVEEEKLVEMNWTAVEGAVGYTVYWCQGSPQFRICNDELDWISVDENTTSYNVALGGYEPKQFLFGISAESRVVNDIQQDSNRRKRRSTTTVVSSGIKWSECTHSSNKPVRRPQNVKFAEHQDPETITLEWTHPKCGESAYIDEYIVSYCQVTNCPEEDPANAEVIRVPVDNALDEFTLVDLTPLVEYKVWVQSHSPNKGLSSHTDGQQITVQPSGLSKGLIALWCILGIFVGFFIIFGLYQTVKRACRTVKENTTLKVELPPDVGSTFSHSNFEETVDSDYMQNYTTLIPVAVETQEKDSKSYPRPPNGNQGRGYFTNGLSRSRDTTYGVGVSQGSTSSNDTMLTLLQHPSSDSLDEVFDSGIGASIGHDQSVSSGLRLTPVPEEATGGDAGWLGTDKNYDRQTSATSQHSTSTIPGYSRCGVPDNDVIEVTNEEPPAVTSTTQTHVAASPTGNHPGNNTPQPNNAGLSPKVPSHSAATAAAARVQTPVAAGHTSPEHPPVGVGQAAEEPVGTDGLHTMPHASRAQITPGGSVDVPGGGGGTLEQTMANPSAAATGGGEADYSMVNTGGTASPSTCMSGASSPHLPYNPQNLSAESPRLPNGTYKTPNPGLDWARRGESRGAEHRHEPYHVGLVPAVKSAATNNNNGYVTVSM